MAKRQGCRRTPGATTHGSAPMPMSGAQAALCRPPPRPCRGIANAGVRSRQWRCRPWWSRRGRWLLPLPEPLSCRSRRATALRLWAAPGESSAHREAGRSLRPGFIFERLSVRFGVADGSTRHGFGRRCLRAERGGRRHRCRAGSPFRGLRGAWNGQPATAGLRGPCRAGCAIAVIAIVAVLRPCSRTETLWPFSVRRGVTVSGASAPGAAAMAVWREPCMSPWTRDLVQRLAAVPTGT